MARRTILVLAATLLGALGVPAAPALAGGGGGCHGDVTTGGGDTVEMVNACFTPTSLRIDPGDTVTFENRDGFVHNVGGNGWGHFDDLTRGDAFTATFEDAGVYPYACSYHPGMTGVVVVGDGTGAGNGRLVSVASYEPPVASEPLAVSATAEERPDDGSRVGWVAGGAIGVVLGLGLGFLVRRRPGRSAAAPAGPDA